MKLCMMALCATALSFGQSGVNYHGGPVMRNGAQVFFIWAGNWSPTDQFPFRAFVQGASSGYLNAATRYYDTISSIQNVSAIRGEAFYPASSVLDGAQMVQLIERTINQSGWPCDSTAVYAFMAGPGISAPVNRHFVFPCGPENGIATPTSVQVPGLSVGNVLATFAHELIESMTNPDSDRPAWYRDSDGLEIVDICQRTSAAYSWWQLSTGTFYLANYLGLDGGCASGSGSGGSTGGGGNPKPPCPPGTRPIGNSGKCR